MNFNNLKSKGFNKWKIFKVFVAGHSTRNPGVSSIIAMCSALRIVKSWRPEVLDLSSIGNSKVSVVAQRQEECESVCWEWGATGSRRGMASESVRSVLYFSFPVLNSQTLHTVFKTHPAKCVFIVHCPPIPHPPKNEAYLLSDLTRAASFHCCCCFLMII